MKRSAKSAIALPAIGVVAIGLFYFISVSFAERVDIGSYGRYGPLMAHLETASGRHVPYFDVNCDQDKFAENGWWNKLLTSVSINYWAAKARSSESAFERHDHLDQEKLAAIAASDALDYWSGVAHAQKELECYDVASALAKD